MRFLPTCCFAILTTAASAQIATYAEFGYGCNGDPIVTPFALNDAAPALQVASLPNEYAYPVFNSAATPVQVLGFDVYTRTNVVPATEVGNAGIFLDNSGPAAVVHTSPANTAAATGTIEVTSTVGWYSVAISPPVVVQPGQAFWVQLDAYGKISPPQHTTAGGVAAPAAIFYRRPSNGMVWTSSVSVARPMLRLHAATTTTGIATLMHATTPVQGQTLTLTIANGPANFPAVMVLGFSDTLWLGGAITLPVDLGFVGAPNCTNFTSADEISLVILDGVGVGTWSVTVPTDIAFLGLHFFNQGGILGAPNGLGVYLTNAGRGTVGT